MIIYIASVQHSEEMIREVFENSFNISPADTESSYKEIKSHFERLKASCWLLAETPYVDKVYRDSYYHYYSSKHAYYLRDCARISIFEGEIEPDDFRKMEKIPDLQSRYLGFIILRPTEPFFIGRSVISPMAIKDGNFSVCTTKIESSVNSIKFQVIGFPHSSQDTETMTCAETTVWAMMEYFGSRYPDYRPALPSRIINTLNKVSFERQVPSKGLSIPQISYALREFGFGTRIYSKDQYEEEFEKLISCYIESGIPVIIAVDNFDKGGKLGHAMIGVGHEKITKQHLIDLPEMKFPDTAANKKIIEAIANNKIRLYDYDDVAKMFVFIDDNCPAYTKAALKDPCKHYRDEEWKKCEVKHLVTPLYKRIYLEAYEGKQFLLNFLVIGPYPLQKGQEALIRFFLTSGRSYKDKLATNKTFSDDVKEKILAMPLPKFIWVAELSNKELMQQRKATGVILLDATEANRDRNKPLVFGAYGGKVIEPDFVSGELKLKPIPLAEFLIYENNLTSS